MPIPVDSKYINPAYLPIEQSLTFPSAGSTGYLLGWGRKYANRNLTTYNRYIQQVELKTLNLESGPCMGIFNIDKDDPSYNVIPSYYIKKLNVYNNLFFVL